MAVAVPFWFLPSSMIGDEEAGAGGNGGNRSRYKRLYCVAYSLIPGPLTSVTSRVGVTQGAVMGAAGATDPRQRDSERAPMRRVMSSGSSQPFLEAGQRIARSKAVYSAIELNGPPAEPLACRFFAAVL